MTDKVSILIVDDHPIFSHGLAMALSNLELHSEVDVAHHPTEAFDKLQQKNYDLVILDIHLPGTDGLSLLGQFKAKYFGLPVVMISADTRYELVEKAKDSGAFGFIPKTFDNARLIGAVRQIIEGKPFYPSELALSSLSQSQLEQPESKPEAGLTGREVEVLRLLAEGMSNRDIEERLFISKSTLKSHLESVFRKLQVNNRTACVVKAAKQNLI
ncbi:MAG: hypothetical protein CMF25_06415 [Kangiellaceae bacterium]|jgi:DNA-binding NarL/FixJ family response regulator|nr:hypothetical protein [Kangiellaceae bacterium]|tara:strand:- start:1614 stop:2255 length:642 start_codon:yes stop_codon:yes gene_type:complete